MAVTINDDEYLSITEAATFVDASPHTVRKWLQHGRLKRFHLIGRSFVKKADLTALLQPGRTRRGV